MTRIRRKDAGLKINADYLKAAQKRRADMLALHDEGKSFTAISRLYNLTVQRVGALIQQARQEAGRPRLQKR